MKIPRQFKLGGHVWRVRWVTQVDPEHPETVGLCDPERRLITLRKDLPNEAQVFLHEWLHAVLFEHSFYVTGISTDLEEILVECIARSLTQSFRTTFKK